jgi:hypothetical protein
MKQVEPSCISTPTSLSDIAMRAAGADCFDKNFSDHRALPHGGREDFFAAERSEWDPETFTKGRYDSGRMMRRFEQANRPIGGDR